ncbi:arylsulfatase [Rhizopus microsporus var. microsporus]|uniref:Arylsulfatase n=1 Tax=Rhizopus microsporus var. microsporus TaxID=86635 RepID=A0A1X0QYV0_RHIZD|nr:arylsulfatase [Rhizopus microsporus var. microsporus]
MRFASLSLGLAALFGLVLVGDAAKAKDSKPNIVFIFTDDQDYRLKSLDYMPNVQKYLVKEGTLHRNHYATISICCPSRVGLLRGQYAHNTNITDVSVPYGGYGRFNELKLGDDYLPLWLQKAGYNTNYIGKLMNQYSVNNYNKPTPKGSHIYKDQLVDPYTYVYNTAVFSKNGEAPVFYKDAYQTDIIHAKARAALKRLESSEDPFFLWVAPMAPHAQFIIHGHGNISTSNAVPAARHAHLFKDVKIPRTAHFNPSKQAKTASYWKHLERLNQTEIDEIDEAYRDRLRSLQAVDEMVGTVFEELERQGKLNNTYVFYSSDNGYHLGQHRSYPGKCTNIEEDINVPFIVRGPGVPKGKVSDVVSSHHDLASTFLALANGDEVVPDWVDGGVIPVTHKLKHHRKPVSKESFAVEFWGDNVIDEIITGAPHGPNLYKTLRVISEDYNYMYSVWCTGEHELYDLKKDPYEMHNLYTSASTQLTNRLDALLVVLKSCRAQSCRDPWRILHPDDHSVKTLKDALHHKYDAHYTQFRKVKLEECLPYYNLANEVPQIAIIQNLHKRQERTSRIPEEYHKLYNLIPKPSGEVGHQVPGDDFEQHAKPVPSELINTPVDWSKYNFYGYGN